MVDLSKLTPEGLKAFKQFESDARRLDRAKQFNEQQERLSRDAYKEPLASWNFSGAKDPPKLYKDHYARHGARVMLAQLRKDTALYIKIKFGRVYIKAADLEGNLLVAEIPLFDVIQDEIEGLEDDETKDGLETLRNEFVSLADQMTEALSKFERKT